MPKTDDDDKRKHPPKPHHHPRHHPLPPDVAVSRLAAVARAMGWEIYSQSTDDEGNIVVTLKLKLPEHAETPKGEMFFPFGMPT